MLASVQELAVSLLMQLLANTPRKSAEDNPSPWNLALMWDTQIKLLVSGFHLTQSQPCRPFGRSEQADDRSLPLFVCTLAFQINHFFEVCSLYGHIELKQQVQVQ